MSTVEEKNQSLWLLTISPAIWAAHLLASYITAAVWCAKAGFAAPLGSVRLAIGAYTIAALIGIAVTGIAGYRRHTHPGGGVPHDADTAEDRHRFLGFSTLLLSGLSAVAVVYAALVLFYFRSCY